MAVTTIYLVCHAHADWYRDEMRPLSRRGRLDAERVGEILADTRPAAIYSSPYRRAVETAEPLARRLDLSIQQIPELRERALGDRAFEDFAAAVEATWLDFSFAHPGGESNAAAAARAAAVYRRLAEIHRHDAVVVVTHGNLMSLMLHGLDPSYDFSFWSSLNRPDILRLTLEGETLVEVERLWRS